jgi:hypothetical protein
MGRSAGILVLLTTLLAATCASQKPRLAASSGEPAPHARPSERVLANRREYFYHLKPGTMLAMVLAAVGDPDSRQGNRLTYGMRHGTVVLEFDGHGLVSANHLNPGDGEEVWLYSREGEWPDSRGLARRERMLSERRFTTLYADGALILVHSIEGRAFVIRDGYVVIEPLFVDGGAVGPFAERIAKVTIYRSGTRKVLYRIWDEWQSLRPAELTDETLRQRTDTLKTLVRPKNRADVIKSLGKSDGSVGSGLLYAFYWIPDGLVTISYTAGGMLSAQEVRLEQPGAETQVDFKAWLGGARPSRSGGEVGNEP